MSTKLTNYDISKHPTVDSTDNNNYRDVNGNKDDTVDGDSQVSLLKRIEAESYNASKVYPTLADDATITGGAGAWQLGAAAAVIPINTIHTQYALHFVNVSVASATDNYELVLYSDAGCTTEIGRTRISKGTVQSSASSVPLRTEVQAAEGGVWAKVASGTGGGDSMEISLSYHAH